MSDEGTVHYEHPSLMTDAEVVMELNGAASDVWGKWHLEVRIAGNDIEFQVAGNVFPFRQNGTRYRNGQITFYGEQYADPKRALRSGLVAMRNAQESKR